MRAARSPGLGGSIEGRELRVAADAAPARVPGVAEGLVAEEAAAHRRVEAVGPHQEIRLDLFAVVQAHRDAIAALLEVDHFPAGAHAIGAAGFEAP